MDSQAKEIRLKTAHGHYHRVRWTPEGLEYQLHGFYNKWERLLTESADAVRMEEFCPERTCVHSQFISNEPDWWKSARVGP